MLVRLLTLNPRQFLLGCGRLGIGGPRGAQGIPQRSLTAPDGPLGQLETVRDDPPGCCRLRLLPPTGRRAKRPAGVSIRETHPSRLCLDVCACLVAELPQVAEPQVGHDEALL